MDNNPGKPWRISIMNVDGDETKHARHDEKTDRGEFDELVVADWFHLERMDKTVWWLRVGDEEFDIVIPRKAKNKVEVRARSHNSPEASGPSARMTGMMSVMLAIHEFLQRPQQLTREKRDALLAQIEPFLKV